MLLQDILTSLTRPGRDPRDDLPPPVFRRGIVKLEDLAPGMELMGTVLNVVDFGAFVDIGLADSGLVHISRLADRFIKDPHEVVGVGDVLKVWVVDVDMQRRRVSLTAIQPGTEKTADQRRAEHAAREPRPQRERPERRPARRRPPAGQAASGAVPQGAAPAGGAPGAATPPQRFERSSRPPRSREYSAPQGRRGPPPSSRPPAPRPSKPKPVRPITKAMEEGREPLRSFSDLAQFWARKSDAPGPEPKTPPPADPPAEPPAT